MVSWFNRRLRRDREDGAALVEFAMVLPLFIVLIFGIMEAGWFFAQNVEVRNAAREGARLAVVDFPSTAPGGEIDIRDETCARAPLSSGTANVSLTYDDVGDTATVTVKQDYSSLTGLITIFDGTVASTVVMRYERDGVPTWADLADSDCP